MKYRQTTVLAQTDLQESGTKDIQIKIRDIISRLTLQWIVTKSKDGMDSYPHKDITKIELRSGSDILFGMDGGQCQALNIYNRRCNTMNHGQAITGESQRSVYGLDFGRFLFDPLLALDPSRFDNLILYVSYDEDVSDTGVTANTLEILADVFDEKEVSPVGFLMSKEHDSRTPPASGYDYIKLPTDHPLRLLLIQGYRAQYEPWYQVSEARLDEENEKRIPFDVDLERWHQYRKGIDPPIIEQLIGKADTSGSQAFYVTPTDYYSLLAANAWGDDYIYREGVRGGGYLVPYSKNAERQFQAIVMGWLPNHCFQFPFGDQMDMDDWYDVTKVGDLRSRIKAGTGGANGTVAHILQQLRRY